MLKRKIAQVKDTEEGWKNYLSRLFDKELNKALGLPQRTRHKWKLEPIPESVLIVWRPARRPGLVLSWRTLGARPVEHGYNHGLQAVTSIEGQTVGAQFTVGHSSLGDHYFVRLHLMSAPRSIPRELDRILFFNQKEFDLLTRGRVPARLFDSVGG